MASGDFVALNLLFIIFLVVPGLAGIKGFLFARREADNYGRIETIAFSLIISTISILFLYSVYSVNISKFADYSDLAQFPLITLILLFIFHSLFSPIIGVLLGMTTNLAEEKNLFSKAMEYLPAVDDENPRKETWDFVFGDIHSNSRVAVVTEQGHIITGHLVHHGDKIQERDLLLSRPNMEILGPDGHHLEKELPDKTYSYIHDQNISQILLEEDLNKGDDDVARDMGLEGDVEMSDLRKKLQEYYDAKESAMTDDTILEAQFDREEE